MSFFEWSCLRGFVFLPNVPCFELHLECNAVPMKFASGLHSSALCAGPRAVPRAADSKFVMQAACLREDDGPGSFGKTMAHACFACHQRIFAKIFDSNLTAVLSPAEMFS